MRKASEAGVLAHLFLNLAFSTCTNLCDNKKGTPQGALIFLWIASPRRGSQ